VTDINGARLLDDLRAFSKIGGRPDGGLDRLAWTAADLEGRQWLASRMETCGLEARTDPALNVFGHLRGSTGPWLLVGSHADSVPRGGRLDGAYGTIAALEVLRSLVEARDPVAEHVEVVGWSDEEGVRFENGLIGSRAVAGELNPDDLEEQADWQGEPVSAVLARAGVDLERISEAHEHLDFITGYLELHIEQGPRMEADGFDLAVVTGIVAVHREKVRIEGSQNHAGTTPFRLRKDAGRAAARLVAGLRELVQAEDSEAVANVGAIHFYPGGINVVPGRADFDLEVRHLKDDVVRRIVDTVHKRLHRICAEEGCRADADLRSHDLAAAMDARIMAALERACQPLGRRVTRLASGAGHDASVMSRHVPTGMLFVPSIGGISHAPEENTSDEHLVLGARALLRGVREVAAILPGSPA
jgi:N-carbamoyl-L-amino-acid hydrolase